MRSTISRDRISNPFLDGPPPSDNRPPILSKDDYPLTDVNSRRILIFLLAIGLLHSQDGKQDKQIPKVQITE
jgi:hypothetical protein